MAISSQLVHVYTIVATTVTVFVSGSVLLLFLLGNRPYPFEYLTNRYRILIVTTTELCSNPAFPHAQASSRTYSTSIV
jgi:hypothetical protein